MRILLVVLVLLVIGTGVVVMAAGNHEGRINTDSGGIAIQGYDPVAYFTLAEAVPGTEDFSYKWNDATWLFASEEHRERFIAEPDAYAPAYGGYCAWAVAEGKVAGIDPKMWHIANGRLYLNYSARINRRFLEDVPGNVIRADRNWPEIRAALESKSTR